MMLCTHCGLQRPNYFKSTTCPLCDSYLKYIEAAAKPVILKLNGVGLRVSYAVAEVYNYLHGIIYTVNICIGLSQNYPSEVFYNLPEGYNYILLDDYTPELLSSIPLDQLITPVCTYAQLRYEVEYLDYTEAKAVLRKKLRELNAWVDEVVSSGWIAICNLGGLL